MKFISLVRRTMAARRSRSRSPGRRSPGRSPSPPCRPSPGILNSALIFPPELHLPAVQVFLPAVLAGIVCGYTIPFNTSQLEVLYAEIAKLVGNAHIRFGGASTFATDIALLSALLSTLQRVVSKQFFFAALSDGLQRHFKGNVPEAFRNPTLRRYCGYELPGCLVGFDLRVFLESHLEDVRERVFDNFSNQMLTKQIDDLMLKLE